ncbi:MAG: DsbA family protein [Xanthomonadaceae bacterium]|jgi:protein-disulfide isomerase|nr:DsbA family protein [Xanthomonadaceae bacterium]
MYDLLTLPGPQDHHQGYLSAPLVLVKYGDYQCPHCCKSDLAFKAARRILGERLCIVFRQFPRREIHPCAERSAELAEAAASQGLFWAMHGMLFENQELLDDDSLRRYAQRIGLDRMTVAEAFSGHYRTKVRQDVEDALRSGVEEAPCFFINGRRYAGDPDADELLQVLQEVLVEIKTGTAWKSSFKREIPPGGWSIPVSSGIEQHSTGMRPF